ncbi:Glucose-6-phosphate 1-dehydrogenase [hydrothermal vent metagenome]|uniref:Glucose-6-phosphate 1-dehydrogenase n=1 Tax=hydrothermal vent metagenome TaxID=652676 RepID=A0A3B0YBQ4_9ZZZZ
MEDSTFVIFGATGNLSRIKLIPALYHLDAAGRLTDGMKVVGFGRRDWDDDAWRAQVRSWLAEKNTLPDVLERFLARFHFCQGDLADESAYPGLKDMLLGGEHFSPNIVFYMAIRPADFGKVSRRLGECDLASENGGWRRLVIEKPFGYDLESAESLNHSLNRDFNESQIFRIDHYLGKGTVQNVLVFRFANLMLEPLWNRNYIDHVQITHSESLGTEGRAGYYDGAGALRDMIQSHLLQVLTLVAMEPPASLDAESLRDEKVKVLRSIRPIPQSAVNAHAVRAQYTAGSVNGEKVPGYLNEPDVPENSVTETYAALKLFIDNWRWRNVPFFLRTGKRMAKGNSMVAIRFKHPPQQLFRETQIERLEPNWILMNLQPNECIRMEMQVKQTGLEMRTETTRLDASYCGINPDQLDAYEALLLDVIEGDHSLFLRYDEVSWAWKVVDPILKVWSVERDYITGYNAGSWGPPEADRLFLRQDQYWRNTLDDDDKEDR